MGFGCRSLVGPHIFGPKGQWYTMASNIWQLPYMYIDAGSYSVAHADLQTHRAAPFRPLSAGIISVHHRHTRILMGSGGLKSVFLLLASQGLDAPSHLPNFNCLILRKIKDQKTTTENGTDPVSAGNENVSHVQTKPFLPAKSILWYLGW